MIQRNILKYVIELLSEFPAVAITGPRQAGKTTLIKSISKILPVNCLYIDLENPRDEIKLSDPVLFFENNQDKCIIIDEVQRRKDLFPILRAMIDQDRRPARFLLSGSASPDLIRDSSESLAGRIFYIELSPFHSSELPESSQKVQLLRGGFPNAFLAVSDRMSALWREGFLQTYVEKDLPLLGLPLSPAESRRLLRMLAHLNGQLLNYSAIANALGLSSPSVKKYIHFLEHAYLIRLLEPCSGNGAKRLIKSPKIYLRDSGLLNTLLGISSFNDLLGHPSAGSIWEGYVLEQIRSILPYNSSLCFYRSSHGAELDIIITLPKGNKLAAEVKFSSAPSLSRGNFEAMKELDTSLLHVIVPSGEEYWLKQNVQVLGLSLFIQKIKNNAAE